MHKLGRKIIIFFDFLSIFFVFFMIIFSHNSAFPEPYFVIKKITAQFIDFLSVILTAQVNFITTAPLFSHTQAIPKNLQNLTHNTIFYHTKNRLLKI